MPKFSSLFKFSPKEVEIAFKYVTPKGKQSGLTLLQAPLLVIKKDTIVQDKKLFQDCLEQGYGKLLIIISKKVGKAYQRNKLKRQLKAIFYEEKLYNKKAISILVTYKPALQYSYDNLKNFLKNNI